MHKMPLGMVLRMMYPNWLNVAFFTKGWGLFFREEVNNLSVLLGLVFLWHYLVAGWAVGGLMTHVAVVVGVRRLMAGGLCTSTKRLLGQTVIVTGANAGIGKETARDMFRRGARVIMACRDLRKAEVARQEIIASGGVGGSAEVRRLDLASLQSVREFADGIKKDGIEVHILINNAGLVSPKYKETSDGFELHMGTNHLGHFLLTNLLLPQMKHGLPARIINVSSGAHYFGPLDFDDFNFKKDYDMMTAYARSKLANVLFTRHLAKGLKGTNIQVFSLHPGVVRSDIGREMNWNKFASYFMNPLIKTSMEGAQTTIYCALEARQHPEMYFTDCAVAWANPDSKDDALADKLWKHSAKLVKLELRSAYKPIDKVIQDIK